jgi:hypothetical protein
MSFSPSPLQTLFLWRVLVSGGGEFLKTVKPEIDAKDRKALEAAGLITVGKRKASEAKGVRATTFVTLSEEGWSWAAEHLDAEFSQRSPAVGPVLFAVLRNLKLHLARTHTSLADFISPPAAKSEEPASSVRSPGVASVDLARRIRDAYCRVSGGRWGVRVRLADLRPTLADAPREALDAALLGMEREGEVVLYPLDDPREIRPGDESAGLPNSLGILRHIVYIER